MAPRRQAALAAQANMAAFAAQETENDYETPPIPPKPPKATKTSKPLKKIKPSNVNTNGRGSGYKPADRKSSDAKNSDGNSIPLLCCACPSFPRFSDVSHLLTHLSSKGHLHTLNNLKLSALADPTALQTVNSFDKWYSDNNLQQLLVERLQAAKGGKRPGPVLVQPLQKKKTLASIKAEAGASGPWTPTGAKNNDGFEHQEAITFFGGSGDSTATSPTDSISDDVEEDTEAARLKGIIWPGMNLFDAATPAQRKKRNQRKDASVLRQMELDSQAVTSTEMVANLTLEVERTRDVYDAPSVEGTPPTKKSRRQKRSQASQEDDHGTVKAEPGSDDEHPRQATRAKRGRVKQVAKAQAPVSQFRPSPEVDLGSHSERFEVTSNEDASHHGPEAAFYHEVSGGSNTSLGADLTANLTADFAVDLTTEYGNVADPDNDPEDEILEAEINTSQFAEQMNNYQTHYTIPDSLDVFQDALAGQSRARPEYMHSARFDVRHRIPLQSMNPNSSISLASPTPSAKQFSHRNFRGKENNHGLQDQGLGNHNYNSGPNTHLNQRRMTMGTVNHFNTFPQSHSPNMPYRQDIHWLHAVPRAEPTGFSPINGPGQPQPWLSNVFPLGGQPFPDNDTVPSMNVFGTGV